MKSKKLWLAILALVLVFGMTVVGCDNDPKKDDSGRGGTFTLTNIPSKYNGKYADYAAIYDAPFLGGASSINISTGVINCVQISNGSVSIPMWVAGNSGYKRYSGNRTVTDSLVTIYNSSTVTIQNVDPIAMVEFESVTFSSGNATKSWNDGEVTDLIYDEY